MGRASGRAVMNGQVTEKEFQQTVVDFARLRGWRTYHTHDSRRSDAGFPDLVMVRGDRLVFAELKTEKGRLSAAQEQWREALAAMGEQVGDPDVWPPQVGAFVWRPSNWPVIEAVLA